MRLRYVGLAVLFTLVALPARAELLRAKRASVMCASAGALAKLALPGGGSRDVGDHAPPNIAKIASDGSCIDFPEGHVVILEKARARTSIVSSDSLSGDGVMAEVIVANIDYEPYAPPPSVFYDTIRAKCPGLLDAIAAEEPPRNAFIESLPAAARGSIEKAVDENCGGLGRCMVYNQAAEIGRRHLEGRWAEFLCAHPRDAVEPRDQSWGGVRD